jgi:hypothetical protein
MKIKATLFIRPDAAKPEGYEIGIANETIAYWIRETDVILDEECIVTFAMPEDMTDDTLRRKAISTLELLEQQELAKMEEKIHDLRVELGKKVKVIHDRIRSLQLLTYDKDNAPSI